MKCRICEFICVIFLITVSLLQAQPITTNATIYLNAKDVLQGQEFTLTQSDTSRVALWRYHPGDDTTGAWAMPEFDDSAWELVSPSFYRNSFPPGMCTPPRSWRGVGWFRVKIHIDSALRKTLFAMRVHHMGASEVYCNGERIFSNGIVSTKANHEQPPNGKLMVGFTIYPPFENCTTVTLAVRYSNMRAEERYQQYRYTSDAYVDWFGFGVQICTKKSSQEKELKREQTQFFNNLRQGIFVGIFGILGIFNTVLYLLNRNRERTLLWYSCFLWGMVLAGGCYFVGIYADQPSSFSLAWVSRFLSLILLYVSYIFYIQFIAVSLERPISTYLIAAAVILELGILATYPRGMVLFFAKAGLDNFTIRDIIELCFDILYGLELFRLSIISIRHKTKERYIAIASFFVAVSFLVTAISNIIWYIYDVWILGTINPNEMQEVLVKLPLPIITSILLAIRTTDMTKRIERQNEILEEQVTERTKELQFANEEISRQMEVQAEQAREIEKAHHESESLLLNILPAPIAHRLKSGERAIADKFDAVTVLFADIVGFTKLSARTTPEELVQGLNAIFGRFDELAKKYGLEKIKTIGDAYMVAGGLPERSEDHAERVARFALEIQAVMQEEGLRTSTGEKVELRIGIHTGEAVAGVIGTSKFQYDLWGDTVNTASRMESHGEAGKIHVSEEVFEALKEKFVFEERGEVEIKGKGVLRTYYLMGTITSF